MPKRMLNPLIIKPQESEREWKVTITKKIVLNLLFLPCEIVTTDRENLGVSPIGQVGAWVVLALSVPKAGKINGLDQSTWKSGKIIG